MDNVQDVPGQDGLASEVLEDVGMPNEAPSDESHEGEGEGKQDDLPKGVKDRLGRQEKRHQREMRQMRAQLESMKSQMSQPAQDDTSPNPYDGGMQTGGIDEQIQKAVGYALQQKELQERKADELRKAQYVQKQYGDLDKHLNTMADKYYDFEDVVRNDSAPFTNHMRDAALMLPKSGPGSAGEVLYKLGKNPAELERIASLHPLDQASELVKLSHALIGGNSAMKSQQSQPLGNIKSNPVTNSPGITEKTPVSELRARMKNNWK